MISYDKDMNPIDRELTHLSSQMKQGICQRTIQNVVNLSKKESKERGRLKFKYDDHTGKSIIQDLYMLSNFHEGINRMLVVWEEGSDDTSIKDTLFEAKSKEEDAHILLSSKMESRLEHRSNKE